MSTVRMKSPTRTKTKPHQPKRENLAVGNSCRKQCVLPVEILLVYIPINELHLSLSSLSFA